MFVCGGALIVELTQIRIIVGLCMVVLSVVLLIIGSDKLSPHSDANQKN